MKKRTLIVSLLFAFATELLTLLFLAAGNGAGDTQDTVLVNEVVRSVQADWDAMADHEDRTGLAYVVLDLNGTVLFRTGEGLSESVNTAVSHRDTILDVQADGSVVGKVLIYNDSLYVYEARKRAAIAVLACVMLAQCLICILYVFYLDRAVIRPFRKLKGFAERIAGGNLDVPLEMDRKNLFGAFTESFDIMRSELRKARRAEAEANAGKKELVAKLSHDIKTPVASIKAASEVGSALTDNERVRENYSQIIRKADQIDSLITNLFTATLEELEQLTVTPEDLESGELKEMLENADYMHRAVIPDIPGCLLYADRLRLQQVFDNIFANSYKYAGTEIEMTICRDGSRLAVCVEDHGGGVGSEELLLLKEKFHRGKNAGNKEGAGLGLYISDHFMREMGGELAVENGERGLKVTVGIRLSGVI
ncbi:MAG: HAMP domain-containing histidine kinase [Eubacterium sp.]|nr:HAMP domain-containing histidine kinase [Eubacterium sp.]MCM1213021.1 HAMP domain-containing histidine kinase [Lachnospiraceae bacterium]MCM1304165.1 HAMP domain-containing histidine kinase [Butyrivibrio sp.]MCM1344716.1 HAMP domain-containing histidine kinase [Muribaculaceae bacterium]MCM1241115.1 HAMP domain-containing histidine kinase [Lachnospiraceae bacterium]